MREVTLQQLRAMRLGAQRLYPRAGRSGVEDVVRALCGVNAQFRPAMLLALRARLRGLEPRDVTDLAGARRSLVRTWAMRGTIHLFSRDDPGWMLPILSPTLIFKSRRRRLGLGLDEERLARGLREICAILSDSQPLTRGELVDRLNDRGLAVERKSQVPYHLLAYAGLAGLICMGPDRSGGEETYVLAAEGSKALSRDAGLAELARRYLEGYGPASPADFAAWSGLPMAAAKTGWALLKERGLLADVLAGERVLGALETQLGATDENAMPDTAVNLLPAFDTLILGYADRSRIVPEKYYGDVYHGGQTVPVVLVDGVVAGVWRYEVRGKRMSIEVRPLETLGSRAKELVAEEAEDVGRFFGLAPTLTWHGGGT